MTRPMEGHALSWPSDCFTVSDRRKRRKNHWISASIRYDLF